MTETTDSPQQVWVFNGNHNHFPSAVFTERHLAEEWIERNAVQGTLTAYPLDTSVYDYAVRAGWFTPEKEDHATPEFIANFRSASQEHYHFEDNEV